MKCNLQSHYDYFSLNVYVLSIVLRQQISKNGQFQSRLLFFFKRKSLAKYSNYNVKTQRKIIRTWLCIIKQFLFTYRNFESFESFKNNKKTLKNCWCLVKTTLSIYLILSKLVFFETSIIFLELALK